MFTRLLLEAFWRHLVKPALARDAPPKRTVPSPQHVVRIDDAYRAWAAHHRLVPDDALRGYRGLHGEAEAALASQAVAVRVRPGLDGSAPVGVEVELDIEHGAREAAPLPLLKKTTTFDEALWRESADLAVALQGLFDERGLEALRSVAIVADGLRLRFDALAEPKAIDLAIACIRDRLTALAHQKTQAAAPYR